VAFALRLKMNTKNKRARGRTALAFVAFACALFAHAGTLAATRGVGARVVACVVAAYGAVVVAATSAFGELIPLHEEKRNERARERDEDERMSDFAWFRHRGGAIRAFARMNEKRGGERFESLARSVQTMRR